MTKMLVIIYFKSRYLWYNQSNVRYANNEFRCKSMYNSCKTYNNLIKEYVTYWAFNQYNLKLRVDI